MYVRIKSCSRPSYWYADKIGEIIEVHPNNIKLPEGIEKLYLLKIKNDDDDRNFIGEKDIIPIKPLYIFNTLLMIEKNGNINT